MDVALRNPAELALRLDLGGPERLLLVDVPDSLCALAAAAREGRNPAETVRGEAIRSVKELFHGIVLWREERPGSLSLLAAAAKRLAPGGVLWVVVALRKVAGVRTPAVHRLGRDDLVQAFAKEGLACGLEVRVTAWHVAYRFVKAAASARAENGKV